jgi:AraC-like DNA-binding protein
MQILPSIELIPFIKHYIFLESRGNDLKKLRLFSDGNMAIVFSFKSKLVASSKNNGPSGFLPNSFLYGQISAFKDVYLSAETYLIIVVFQPYGINQLLNTRASELRDNIIPTEYLFGKQVPGLYEKLSEGFTIAGKLELLNGFFKGVAERRKYFDDSLIKASVRFIVENKGLISSRQLVKLTGFTERHIERKFSESIGITPRKFGNVIKLHHFLRQLKTEPANKRLTAFAYEAGYTDQSHLIKEFKKITGMTPGTYINKADKLTVNFVKFIPGKMSTA